MKFCPNAQYRRENAISFRGEAQYVGECFADISFCANASRELV